MVHDKPFGVGRIARGARKATPGPRPAPRPSSRESTTCTVARCRDVARPDGARNAKARLTAFIKVNKPYHTLKPLKQGHDHPGVQGAGAEGGASG
jgi:hypothetical protein